MKKVLLTVLLMALGTCLMAQQKIQLRSADKAECVKSDMTSLKASFSFSGIEARDYQSERGTFSWITMPNTVISGNEGDPQIPVINELIAVPFGAKPRIEVTSYSTTEYRLADYGINTVVPRQPSLRKDQRPEEVPFVYNEAAYQSTRGFRSEPLAVVSVEGTMRGIQVGKMIIEPVSYDPVNNTLRVFNNIEVEVHFDGADAKATEDMLLKTYTPYFDIVYAQMFNGRSVKDAYSEHPDLYRAPVKMMIITTETYANNTAFQNWVNWKIQKGFYTTVYTTATTGTTAANIKSFIRTKYAEEAPTFVVLVGDTDAITYSLSSSNTSKVTDLYYSTTSDSDIYPDMFLSRMPISSTGELENLLHKIMTYEQYTMADPSYLSNVLLIAGSDGTWNPRVGQPTINYAADNYFNTAHGFNNVHKYLDSYTNCYNNLNTGVGFANYTAHGGETGWSGPAFSVSDANSLTNTDKYFWAMGNCCLAANWGYDGVCFAESLLRGQNKGAFGYIGSCPETYWWEDYYFGVGATTTINTTPAMSDTQTGAYDAMFMDDMYNTLNSVPFLGNIAVCYAHANTGTYNNSISSGATDTYYWEAYHTLGDGSVMPYHVNPSANHVNHASTIGIGLNTFTVNADAGSYVAISKDNVLLGAAQVDATGMVNVPIDPVTSGGDVLVVVTRQQRQPYMQTIQAVSLDGPYIALDGYTPNTAHVGDNTNLSLTFKNVGADATVGNTNITLIADDSNVVTITEGTGSFGALAADATTTVNGFQFKINSGVADGTNAKIHYIAENGTETYEGNIVVVANEAVLAYQNMSWNGGFTPGETLTLTAKFKNTGHYQATNAVAKISTTSSYLTLNNQTVNVGTIAADQEVSCQFSVTINANCPETEVIPVTFAMTAEGDLSAQGNENLKNACNVIFNLNDSYGDGWNGASLVVSFNDGSDSQSLTFSSGSSASFPLEIGNGTHVTLTWSSGSYDGECSFSVQYEGDLTIYQSSGSLSAGVLYEFDCNCAAATSVYTVTATSSNPDQGTVSGGGDFSFGQSCTVTATPADGYMFTNWTQNGVVISGAATYTFIVNNDVTLVAHFSEGTMIGDGGTTTNNYLPSYNYYNYSLTQQIYTKEEFGAPGLITSIAFYNGGTEKTRTYDFYMKNTEKSTFSGGSDWETVTEADKVFSGSVTMTADAWTFITFDTPFIYDGSSNLVFVANDKSGDYSSSPHMACRVFNATNQAIYKYQDGGNLNPFDPTSISGNLTSVKNQIIITKEPFSDCMAPVNLTATEVGPDFVKLSWDEIGASTEWVVVYGGYFTNANTNVDYLLTGLEPETDYTILVRPACDENLFSSSIHITTLEACPAPQNIEVSNITHAQATVTWSDYNDSYKVQLGAPAFLISTNFDNGIPADWTNDASYPWTVVDGHIQSGNSGVASSTSSISVTATYPADGTISFDFWSRGEGSDSNDWDKCRFYIDDEMKFDYGVHTTWESYSIAVTAGTHTFKWEYKKDGSVNADGDCFIVDNIEMKAGETSWNEPIAVENAIYNFTGLTPLTTYYVRVQGLCGSTTTEWSNPITFTTVEFAQIVVFEEGWNWFVPTGNITLADLEAALGTNGISINTQTGNLTYEEGQWLGDDIPLIPGHMYKINVSADCNFTLTGTPTTNVSFTIVKGYNWFGYTGTAETPIELILSNSGFTPVEGDIILTGNQNTSYEEGEWLGDFDKFVPGQGYIYISKDTQPKPLNF